MKKGKRKIGFIIGCVALSLLLAVSSYISLVIVGVVVDENKNGTLVSGDDGVVVNDNNNVQNNNVIIGNPSTDNGIAPQGNNNGDYVNNGNVNNGTQNNGTQNNGNAIINNNGNVNQPQGNTNQNITQVTNDLLNTDKTKADIVNIYALVMNKAKADKPGFTKIEYQQLPGGAENRVVAEGSEKVTEEDINKLMGFIEGLDVFVPKEEAEKDPYIHEKGDADMSLFPVFFREKGSYLTDPNGIESFTYKILPNGNVKMTFVLVSEDNPEPIAENSNVSPSYTGAVFAPMSKERIDGTVYHPIVTVFAKNIEYSLRYHDCSVELEFNPETLQVVSLNQFANVSIKGSGDVVGIGFIGLERQELLSKVYIKDFKY
ncbi:MAG: hypothetical protein IJ025_03435 [Clostridia bacterium]|nr:hypothetical protein [Clostridia bacterium]